MATIIDGKAFAAKIRSQVKEDADNLIAKKTSGSLFGSCISW